MKAQLIGQVFIYLITVILVVFLLSYGYKAITTFRDKADQISYIQFKNNLENTIEVLSVDFGSVKVKDFVLPENIKEVCFVKNYEGFPTGFSSQGYPLIEDSVRDNIQKNIFLVQETIEESFIAGEIELTDEFSNPIDFICIPTVNGEINLRMEGMGDHTIISRYRNT